MAFEAFRQRIGSIIGGFDAAQAHRRLRGFRASRAHVNTLIATSGDTITARARWLVRNNGYAANAVESFASNVVGDGIKPSSSIADATRKEELQALWLAWTDDADAEGLTDFYGLQRRAAREVFLSGEVFIRIRPRRAEDGLTVPLQLQMLPAEMLPLEMNRTLPGAGLIRQGIEFDGIGRRIAYHFLRRHPGDVTDPGLAGETVRVPAADVIHVLDPVEAGQLRGVSRFAAAIVKLFTLDLYDDAELERKKIAAMFAMFITSPAPETRRGCVPPGHASLGRHLRAVSIPHPAANRGGTGHPLRLSDRRHRQGQLLQHTDKPHRIPPPHLGLAAWRAGVSALPRGLGALDGRGRAVRCAGPARL